MSTDSATSAMDTVIAAQQAQVRSQIAFALAAKKLSVEKQIGGAMVELVQAAESLSRELGKGSLFDAVG